MEKSDLISVRWYWILSLIVLTGAGFVFHFINDWTGNFFWTAFLAPVNESIWEHLKLLYMPGIFWLLFSLLFFGRRLPSVFPAAQLAGILTGLLWITTAYYTLFGITGRHWMVTDIGIFILSCILCEEVTVICCCQPDVAVIVGGSWGKTILFVLALLLGLCFIQFTYAPPKLPFFLDASSGRYGI